MTSVMNAQQQSEREIRGWAYCPICTHIVETPAMAVGRKVVVKPGQKCSRCHSALEAASVVGYDLEA